MKYTILRPTALFGENHKGSIYELAKLAKFGFLPIIGNESRTNFYFIDDFCDVIINVIFLEKAYNETYICSDSSLTYRDLSSHIAKNMGIRIKLLQFPLLVGYLISISLNILSRVFLRTNPLSFQRLNAISRKNIYSNKKISEQLFIKPRIGVVSGLRKTVSWFKSNGLL